MLSLVPQSAQMSKSQNRPRRKASKKQIDVPPNQLVYRGPSRLPSEAAQNDVAVVQINNSGTITTSAGGQVATVFDSYSQASTPTDWTQLAQLYTEFRILSMEVEFAPWNKYNQPTTNVLPPVFSVIDRANNTPLGSVAQAIAYTSSKIHEPSTHFIRTVKMNGSGEADWTPVGSTPPTDDRMYLKLYCTGASNSINLYDFFTKVIVQFRGRQ